MASYLATLWRSLTGSNSATFTDSDFLDALHPRHVLKTPRRLPTTPTESHLPPARQVAKDTGKKSKQCPHCRKTFYVQLPSGRISKPKTQRVKGKGKAQRWVNVENVYKIEDLSPTITGGYKGQGKRERRFRAGKGKKTGKMVTRSRAKKAGKGLGKA